MKIKREKGVTIISVDGTNYYGFGKYTYQSIFNEMGFNLIVEENTNFDVCYGSETMSLGHIDLASIQKKEITEYIKDLKKKVTEFVKEVDNQSFEIEIIF